MQRGLVITLAASEKSAFERSARSGMLENAVGDCNSLSLWASAFSPPISPAAMPAASVSANETRIAVFLLLVLSLSRPRKMKLSVTKKLSNVGGFTSADWYSHILTVTIRFSPRFGFWSVSLALANSKAAKAVLAPIPQLRRQRLDPRSARPEARSFN